MTQYKFLCSLRAVQSNGPCQIVVTAAKGRLYRDMVSFFVGDLEWVSQIENVTKILVLSWTFCSVPTKLCTYWHPSLSTLFPLINISIYQSLRVSICFPMHRNIYTYNSISLSRFIHFCLQYPRCLLYPCHAINLSISRSFATLRRT